MIVQVIQYSPKIGVYLDIRTYEVFRCYVPFVFLESIVLTSLFSLFN